MKNCVLLLRSLQRSSYEFQVQDECELKGTTKPTKRDIGI
jgi:hypothetical protein